MAIPLQLRRGTTAQHTTFTGAVGEVTVDTDKDTLIVHDGTTAGGFQVAKTTKTSTDNAIARFDGTTGAIQNSGVVIDDSVNVGVGVIPSSWNTAVKAVQVKGTTLWNYNNLYSYFGNNYYFDGTNRVYINNGYAQELSMLSNGSVALSTAPSGTAGNNATFTTALTIPSTGGIQLPNTAIANATTLDWYEEGTATLTATGMTTAPTGAGRFTRNGDTVIVNFPTISGTSNATTFTLTGIPTNFRPSADRNVLVRTQDNGGAIVVSNATINSSGVLTMFKDAGTTAFTASGTKSVQTIQIQYHI